MKRADFKHSNRRVVSIQDIAEAAGVSHSTVSRALHDSELISPEVRQRIQQLAQEMGYTPNAVAQSLKRKRTNTVGLVVTSISDPFLGRVVRGIEDTARAAGVSVFLSISYNEPERELEIIENFQRRRVDGVISSTSQLHGPYVQRLMHLNILTVVINQQAEAGVESLHFVDSDDYDGARQATSYLLSLGHKRIGYIGVGDRAASNQRRLRGYCDTLSRAGIQPKPSWIHFSAPTAYRSHTDDVLVGQTFLPGLLQAGVTAVFCYNDMVAVGVLMKCRELGVRVPQELSVVGYDDVEVAAYVTPPLTTVHQPKLRLGELAMQMLLDLLDGRPVQDQVLPVELVVRESTAPPNATTNSDRSRLGFL
ncbi:LacI family DNA-binding transcriptional regulator [Caldilinea sp.]|uniref:LacI family DNA-binding transcriptional regulator n=1 Tax=Caldilinea sp. TaxID=2293560 RepID=UPI00260174EE|nr:LacI family DNA-binding transcriptional regulator [uncultured Caldilinea sp.]